MRRRLALAWAVAMAAAIGAAGGSVRFYPDDPLWVDRETQDAAAVAPRTLSPQYDFVENTFLDAGERADIRALNVNTVDEVPDSSWFTNRIGRRAMSDAEVARGPAGARGPAPGGWTIIAGKSEGRTAGMTIRDAAGTIYFIKFDPPSNPEMASGAEVIATRLLYAAGYHVPENSIARVRREDLTIAADAEITEDGRARRMEPWDLDAILGKAARHPDGRYRVLASRALEGRPVGPFRYYGTRPDDPNDIFPHEHHRELRGLAVLAAWLNHDDSRAINTLDTLIASDGRTVLRHHLIDFGSTFGSGSTQSQSPRSGNEFLWEARPTFITMLTLGLYVRPWIKVPYPDIRAVGRFEAEYFTPEQWKPEYPNPAFANARADDRFWAARLVASIPESAVAAVVRTADYSDAAATAYMTRTIAARRVKVLRSWLAGTNPVIDPALDARGVLTFANAAEAAGVAGPPDTYGVQWSSFDNETGRSEAMGAEARIATPRATAPAALLASRPGFVAVRIRTLAAGRPEWARPVEVQFRRSGDGWTLVGLERLP